MFIAFITQWDTEILYLTLSAVNTAEKSFSFEPKFNFWGHKFVFVKSKIF